VELSPFQGDSEDSEAVGPEPAAPAPAPVDDASIRALVRRLSRADAKGGATIERAAIMAEGAQLDAVVEWIVAHDGRPEERPVKKSAGRGLHAARLSAAAEVDRPPLRYVLPAAALADPT
jgi:hypothetical protein